MTRRAGISAVILAALAAGAFLPGAPQAAESCVSAACHAGMLKAKHVHPAMDPCATCHQPVAAPHPQKKGKTFQLTAEVPALCAQCHAGFGAMKNVHPPVKDGRCTSCHDPHGSAEPKLLRRPMKDLCASCHAAKTQHRFLHGPAATGDCTSCHSAHESQNARLLVKTGAELCFQCHTDMQQEVAKKVVHQALDGGCTSCHDPHGSAVKKFFPAPGAALCYQCHAPIEEKLKAAKSVHQPVQTEKGCASCHAPHASDAPKLLAKTGKDLCLDCHKSVIRKNQTVLHGPVGEGKCTACHDPHGTPNARLLVRPYSSEFYVSYTDAAFPLCFGCHNRDLLRFPTTSFATGFRDGNRNLHYLHVNRKDRGKSCRVCHAVHAGESPKLLVDKVPFGKWGLPVKFEKTETGGSCAPGCHQPYTYDRKNPTGGKEPEKSREKEKPKRE
jgi:predicted CXXCH cytochrome family protein